MTQQHHFFSFWPARYPSPATNSAYQLSKPPDYGCPVNFSQSVYRHLSIDQVELAKMGVRNILIAALLITITIIIIIIIMRIDVVGQRLIID
jgi:hypothetical protein